MNYAKTLLNIIQGCQSNGNPVVVYCHEPKELVREIFEQEEVIISTKAEPDYYYNDQGYSRFRINKHQFTLTLNHE